MNKRFKDMNRGFDDMSGKMGHTKARMNHGQTQITNLRNWMLAILLPMEATIILAIRFRE